MIIGNAYASQAELKAMTAVNRYQLELMVDFVMAANQVEKEIVISNQHFRRGDITSLVVRSTEVRKTYLNEDNFPHDCEEEFKRGDVVIGNNQFGKYKNELQLVLELHQDKQKNLVGRIRQEEIFLLEFILPWSKFCLKERME